MLLCPRINSISIKWKSQLRAKTYLRTYVGWYTFQRFIETIMIFEFCRNRYTILQNGRTWNKMKSCTTSSRRTNAFIKRMAQLVLHFSFSYHPSPSPPYPTATTTSTLQPPKTNFFIFLKSNRYNSWVRKKRIFYVDSKDHFSTLIAFTLYLMLNSYNSLVKAMCFFGNFFFLSFLYESVSVCFKNFLELEPPTILKKSFIKIELKQLSTGFNLLKEILHN